MSLSATKCSRLLVIFCNVLFSWISGSLLVFFGVVYLYYPSYMHFYTVLTVTEYPFYPFLLFSLSIIGLGGFIITLGLFGCFGTLCENQCIVKTYVYLLVLVFLLEVALGAGCLFLYFVFPSTESNFQANLLNEIKENYEPADGENSVYLNETQRDFNAALDYTQSHLHCCGVYNYTDYEWSSWRSELMDKKIERKVPYSCCSRVKINQGVTDREEFEGVTQPPSSELLEEEDWMANCQSDDTMLSNDFLYVQGCWPQLKEVYLQHTLFASILFFALALLQLLGVIFPVCWVKRVQRKSVRLRRNTRVAEPLL